MLKEEITYEDFDGNERTDTFWFNLTTAEILELEMKYNGDLSRRIYQLGQADDGAQVITIFKDVLAKAYGVRTGDGGFDKDPTHFNRFQTTEAYSELFVGFINDPRRLARFVSQIVSGKKKLTEEEVQAEIDKRFAAQGIPTDSVFRSQKETQEDPFQRPPTSTGPRPPVRPTQG